MVKYSVCWLSKLASIFRYLIRFSTTESKARIQDRLYVCNYMHFLAELATVGAVFSHASCVVLGEEMLATESVHQTVLSNVYNEVLSYNVISLLTHTCLLRSTGFYFSASLGSKVQSVEYFLFSFLCGEAVATSAVHRLFLDNTYSGCGAVSFCKILLCNLTFIKL